jgi:hypothetical protein
MNCLYMRRFLLFLFFTSFIIGSCNAQFSHKTSSKNVEKGLFGKTIGTKKKVNLKEPRSVVKARNKQEANEKKLKKEYAQSIKRSQERTVSIQTPEVQARMKQNQKDTTARDKEKKKKTKAGMKKAGRKYN